MNIQQYWSIDITLYIWRSCDWPCIVHVTVHRDEFLTINQLDALISQIYFWNEILHVSDSSSVHRQEFSTVHTEINTGYADCCSQDVSKPVWHMPLLCAQWKIPDDGQRNCPKHVEFHSKNKFEKLVHLVGFIIRNLSRCTVTWTSYTVCSSTTPYIPSW